jgi:hypothetical protein
MGSTTRRRGVYGGEFSPIGLSLFAWWRKNGERRLHKADSGFAQIRSYQNMRPSTLFYKRHTRLGVGARSNTRTLCACAQRTQYEAARSDRSDRSPASLPVPAALLVPSWPMRPKGTRPSRACQDPQVWPSNKAGLAFR